MSLHPKSINILGRKIRIKKRDLDGDHGRYVHDDAVIYLSDNEEHEKDAWPTLLHEMVHAALTIGGVSEVLDAGKEEAVCRAIENLAPVLSLRT